MKACLQRRRLERWKVMILPSKMDFLQHHIFFLASKETQAPKASSSCSWVERVRMRKGTEERVE